MKDEETNNNTWINQRTKQQLCASR